MKSDMRFNVSSMESGVTTFSNLKTINLFNSSSVDIDVTNDKESSYKEVADCNNKTTQHNYIQEHIIALCIVVLFTCFGLFLNDPVLVNYACLKVLRFLKFSETFFNLLMAGVKDFVIYKLKNELKRYSLSKIILFYLLC